MQLQPDIDLFLDSMVEKVPVKENFKRRHKLVDCPVEVYIFVILLPTLYSHFLLFLSNNAINFDN